MGQLGKIRALGRQIPYSGQGTPVQACGAPGQCMVVVVYGAEALDWSVLFHCCMLHTTPTLLPCLHFRPEGVALVLQCWCVCLQVCVALLLQATSEACVLACLVLAASSTSSLWRSNLWRSILWRSILWRSILWRSILWRSSLWRFSL